MLTVMISISILIKLPVWLWGLTLLLPSHRGALIIGLKVDDSITFLGTVIGNVQKHGKLIVIIESGLLLSLFYGLQSAGIKNTKAWILKY